MTKAEIETKYKALKRDNEDLKIEITELKNINEDLSGKIVILENSRVSEEEIESMKTEIDLYKPASVKAKACTIERK